MVLHQPPPPQITARDDASLVLQSDVDEHQIITIRITKVGGVRVESQRGEGGVPEGWSPRGVKSQRGEGGGRRGEGGGGRGEGGVPEE